MKKVIAFIITLTLIGIFSGVIAQVKEDPNWMTKEKYYNTVIAPQRGLKPLSKELGPGDRKRSVLDVGNVWARISNAATLGYDRWGALLGVPGKKWHYIQMDDGSFGWSKEEKSRWKLY
jgi:hypothetical protein